MTWGLRLSTRTFLACFVPFALLLVVSFRTVESGLAGTARQTLRDSWQEQQSSLAQLYSKSELRIGRLLRVAGTSAELQAGVRLLRAQPADEAARHAVETQLRNLCDSVGFDILLVSTSAGHPLAGVQRGGRNVTPIALDDPHTPARGLYTNGGRTYRLSSAPMDPGAPANGTLTAGEYVDFADIQLPAVLTHQGRVVKSNLAGFANGEIEAALEGCAPAGECEVRLRGSTYLSAPLRRIPFGDWYTLRGLQNLDTATASMQGVVRNGFLVTAIAAALVALALSALANRVIFRPIAALTQALKTAEVTGEFPRLQPARQGVKEIRALLEGVARSTEAVRQGQTRLNRAHVEFVSSLANALDARDPYTAGHSRRVSEYACAIARAIELPAPDVERLRIGALLHDVGKIGIADHVLQKPGRLTTEEFAIIREHPSIGRRILEGVHGFQPYLDAVELHHENWDGTGYPRRLAAEQVPLEARILHVADAYDAMTSDRPYRRGMTHERAIAVLQENAGTQFDPALVSVFTELDDVRQIACAEPQAVPSSVERLAAAVQEHRRTAAPSATGRARS